MDKLNQAITNLLGSFQSLALLCLRLILAYSFVQPALNKLTGFQATVSWFTNGLHLPFPYLNAVLATGAETLGVILLTLGLKTRLISVPLMVTMLVAIVTVHWQNGFLAKNQGFEIPLYFFLMLFVLATTGPGKYSIDHLLDKKS